MSGILTWLLGLAVAIGVTMLFLKMTKEKEWFKQGIGKIVRIIAAIVIFIIGYVIGSMIGKAIDAAVNGDAAKPKSQGTKIPTKDAVMGYFSFPKAS